MINNASLKVILADFWFHFDELGKTYCAIDVVTHFFVAFGLEVDEARQVLLFKFVHAVLG